jgi:hypothetical protein
MTLLARLFYLHMVVVKAQVIQGLLEQVQAVEVVLLRWDTVQLPRLVVMVASLPLKVPPQGIH